MKSQSNKSSSIFLSAHLGFFQKKLLITMYLLQRTGKGIFMDNLLYKRAVLRREGSTLESDRVEVRCFYNAMRRLVRRRFVAVPHRTRQARYPLVMLTDYGRRTVESMIIELNKGFGEQKVIEYIKDIFDLIDALTDACDAQTFTEKDLFANLFPEVFKRKVSIHELTNISLSDFRLFLEKTALYRFSSREFMKAYWTDRRLLTFLRGLHVCAPAPEKVISLSSSIITRLRELTVTEIIGKHKLFSHTAMS